MDSGVDLNHPDLSGRWRGGSNSWFDPYGDHPDNPTDLSGHGTWTMGVMVGGDAGGTAIGLAPDAQWIAVKIFDDYGNATASAIHAGFQWLLDPDNNPGTPDAPHVVNNSWISSSSSCDLQFELDLQALRAAGILPVFAAGNSGPVSNTSRSPANNPSALAVGSTTISDTIDFDSARGPSSCGESESIFPEMVAPGANIHTSDLFGFYTNATGTSLAAPHVSGVLALLLSAYPESDATSQQEALLNGATDLGAGGADNDYGYGRLDVFSAYQWLQGNSSPTPIPVENLALGKPVSVSSFEDSAHDGAMAVDGNDSTYWQTKRVRGKHGPDSESIAVDLSSLSAIDEIVITWGDKYATSYEIELSADGSTWSTAYAIWSGDGGVDAIPLGGTLARYVRMTSTAWSDNSLRNRVKEFEVLGNPGSPAPTDTPTPTNTPVPNSTPTPAPTSTPTPTDQGTIHVGDLDGSSRSVGKNWKAAVTITVHDGNELPLASANVNFSWSGGFESMDSCVTDANGQCSLSTGKIDAQQASVTLVVDDLLSLLSPSYSYDSADNHDPDGNSDGTAITLSKP